MLTIYKASAGSGKTFTLTKQYLTYLLGEKTVMPDGSEKWKPARARNRHRQILAITFTNKATAEMKERIIENLSRISGHGKRSDYVDHLTATLGIDEESLKQLAQRALNDVLFDYQNFNVSTIDSFFQHVLRSLAFELDHPGDFSVEIEQTNVVNEGVSRLMSAFNHSSSRNTPFEKTLRNIMSERSRSGSKSNIFNRSSQVFGEISRYAGDLFDERFKLIGNKLEPLLHDYALREKMAKALEREKGVALARLKKQADYIRDQFTDAQWAGLSKNTVCNPVEKFQNGVVPEFTSYNSSKSYPKWLNDEPSVSDFITAKGAKLLDDPEGVARILAADLRKSLSLVFNFHALKALANELPAYEFMAGVQKHIDEYRLENGVVVLADTNSILKQIMEFEDDVPFVYEKMAMRLEHFLIDEFQDTSRMQWDNLSPMVHNSVAYGNDNLIIGDEKQSIYRFRNSDSSMLHSGVASDPRFAGNVKIEGDRIEQNTNWRTAPQIVHFNNALFKLLATDLGVPGFENVEQQVAPKHANMQGYVLFTPYPEPEETEAREKALDTMVANILRQHAAGYPWKDIAIISNTNNECEMAVRRLQAENIPVSTDDALYIASSPLVRMIVSAMQLVFSASSNSEVFTTTKGKQALFKIHFEFEYTRLLNRGVDPQTAMQQATELIVSRDEAAGDNAAISPALQIVIERQPSTIIELAETVLRECMLRAPHDSMTDLNSFDLTPGQKTYIAAFSDAIDDFVEINGNDLGAFLNFWNTRGDRLTINGAQTSDMVSVMTIHKSKGLEYECVHIPFVDYALEGSHPGPAVWVTPDDTPCLPWTDPDLPEAMLVKLNGFASKELSPLYPAYLHDMQERRTDGLNKSYVAFTRPVRELCVYYDPERNFGQQLADSFAQLYDATSFDPDTKILELGKPTVPEVSDKGKEDTKNTPEAKLMQPVKAAPFYAVAYNDAAEGVTRLVSSAPGDPEPEVTVADDEDPEAMALREAADRGTRLHLVLERVPHAGRLDSAIRRFARLLTDDDIDTLHGMFSHADTAQYVKRWFAPGTMADSEITVLGGPDHAHPIKRIDRVVYHPDGSIDVIDFKFTTAEDPAHHAQVVDYMTLMRLAHPTATVRGYLWYADLHRVTKV